MKFIKKNIFAVSTVFGTLLLIGGLVLMVSISNDKSMEENKEFFAEYTNIEKEDLKQSTIDIMSDENYRFVKSPEKIAKAVKQDDVYVYIFSPECSHCKEYTPILNDVLDSQKIDDSKIMFLNVLEYPEEFSNYQAQATPTMIHYKDGKEVDRFQGNIGKENTSVFFEKNEI